MISLTGLSVSNMQAREITQLYANLDDYDKKPIMFKPRPVRHPKGRFAQSKANRSGHVTIEAMKRYGFHYV